MHVLSVLQYTHKGKIGVIYIDSPYNRGKNDLIYDDDFTDKEDSNRHSKWLSFMEKRLILARELLSEDGVIFCSIDEFEHHNLQSLLNQIFWEKNLVTDFIWKKNSGNNNSKLVSQKHEYILCFAKNKTALGSEFFNSRKTGFDDIISLLDSSKNSGDTVNTAQEKLRILLKSDIFESGTRQYKYVEERDGRFFAFQVADLWNPSSSAENNPEYTYIVKLNQVV